MPIPVIVCLGSHPVSDQNWNSWNVVRLGERYLYGVAIYERIDLHLDVVRLGGWGQEGSLTVVEFSFCEVRDQLFSSTNCS